MRVTGPGKVMVTLAVKDGVVIKADRPIRFMVDWPVERALRTIERWEGWRAELGADEAAQLGRAATASVR
jgi:hypothetical protein